MLSLKLQTEYDALNLPAPGEAIGRKSTESIDAEERRHAMIEFAYYSVFAVVMHAHVTCTALVVLSLCGGALGACSPHDWFTSARSGDIALADSCLAGLF